MEVLETIALLLLGLIGLGLTIFLMIIITAAIGRWIIDRYLD
jgi:hypothetical protein